MCNHLTLGQGYLTNIVLKESPRTRQWMKYYDMSSQHSLTLEKNLLSEDGVHVVGISIDICKNCDGFMIERCNISEWLKSTRTITHTFTLSYNSPTLLFALQILNTLTEHYTRNGKLSGNMVTAIIKNLIGVDKERFLI